MSTFAEALRAEKPFDLLLVDSLMPEMDGVETLERLGQNSSEPVPRSS